MKNFLRSFNNHKKKLAINNNVSEIIKKYSNEMDTLFKNYKNNCKKLGEIHYKSPTASTPGEMSDLLTYTELFDFEFRDSHNCICAYWKKRDKIEKIQGRQYRVEIDLEKFDISRKTVEKNICNSCIDYDFLKDFEKRLSKFFTILNFLSKKNREIEGHLK